MKASIIVGLLCASVGCSNDGGQVRNGQQIAPRSGETGSGSLVAASPRRASHDGPLLPGLWERTFRVVRIDLANVPAEARLHIADPVTNRVCVTPEQAAHPFGGVLARDRARGCSVSRMTIAAGQMSGTQICPTIIATMRGTYSATAYDVTTHSRLQRGGRATNMETHTVARRVGECSASLS